MTRGAPAAESPAWPSIELDRRQHLAVARRLKKAHVRGVGVDDVHLVEVDALPAEPAAQLPGDDEVAGDRRRRAVAQEEGVVRGADRGSPS